MFTKGFYKLKGIVPRKKGNKNPKQAIVEIVYGKGEPNISQGFYSIITGSKRLNDDQKKMIHCFVKSRLGFNGTVEDLFSLGELEEAGTGRKGPYFDDSLNEKVRIAIDYYNYREGTSISTLEKKINRAGLGRTVLEKIYYGYQQPKEKHLMMLSESFDVVPQFFTGDCKIPYKRQYEDYVAGIEEGNRIKRDNRIVVTNLIRLLSESHKPLEKLYEGDLEYFDYLTNNHWFVIDELCDVAERLEVEFYKSKGLSVIKEKNDSGLYLSGNVNVNGKSISLPETFIDPATHVFAALSVVRFPLIDDYDAFIVHRRELLMWLIEKHEDYYIRKFVIGGQEAFNKDFEIRRIKEM